MMKIALILSLILTLFSQGYSNSLDSCQSRCGYGTDPAFGCQCNTACERYGDCCSDYVSLCRAAMSCAGRCGENYNSQNKCHCNSKCSQYNNCCSDYSQLCGGSGGGGDGGSSEISDSEIQALSEVLYALDSNKASASEVILNIQTSVPGSGATDNAPKPLFQFLDEASLFSKPTYAALLALLDNYERMTGVTENFTPEQLEEQETFLRETMSNTELGRELYAFLYTKGRYSSEQEFLQDLKMMWFGLYSRNNGKLDSSGFEHIFAGEIKGGKVSGFHNWLQFYRLEKSSLLNYYGYNFDGPWTSYPDVMSLVLHWHGYYKNASLIVGCSPEFDLALYSLCYITRPGKQCHLSLGGKSMTIQSYTWDNSSYGNGKKFIGSAYPLTPRN